MDQSSELRSQLIIILLTCFTFVLSLAVFILEIKVRADGVLMLSLVTLGTGYDFLGSNIGKYLKNKKILLLFAKSRFSLLNFGIIFTPLSAAFILRKFSSPALCSALVSNYIYFFVISLASGGLFLFAKYTLKEENGKLTFNLDRNDEFTFLAFIVRRIVLAVSLLIALITIVEGLQTELALWTLLYGGLFIATIPLHILHKEISSMTAELATLTVLFYGAYKVYPG